MWYTLLLVSTRSYSVLALSMHETLQENEASLLLMSLADNHNLDFSMKNYTSSIAYSLAYGKRMGKDNKDLEGVIEILDDFVKDCYLGARLVDSFPVLDLLPDILAPWRKEARMKHKRDMEVCT